MAPKKTNGFMTFMFEWKEKNGRNMSITSATSAAGAIWSKMSPKEREPYQKKANVGSLKNQRQKLTCHGTPIDFITREQKEKELSEEQMVKNIERTVKKALEGKSLENEKFYFMMVNYFVRLMNNDIYVPAEIAIVEFSLKEGVSRKYHTFVNPNIDLFGNVYEMMQHADNTHKLPLPPKAMGENDMSKISAEILSFIMCDDNGVCFPPLYTLDRARSYVSSVLSFISEYSEIEDNEISKVQIYSIQELLYSLKCAACDIKRSEKPRNRFVSDTILDKDCFEYSKNIACEFHEEMDRSNYCALSYVYRWGFTFIDYISNELSIQLIPGRHLPDSVNPSEIMRESSSFSSNSARGAMSMLSISSRYQSCNNQIDADKNQTGISSSRNLTGTQPSIRPGTLNTSKQDYNSKIHSIYSTNDLSFNPWHRHDDSKPPDSRFLSIDHDDDVDETRSSTSSRRLGRGRGTLILDEYK